MKAPFAHICSLRLLRLYPRAWRERYADEAAAVLEERPATFHTLFDLFLGLLDAHLHNDLFTRKEFVMLQRLRNSQITIFCSFLFFVPFWAIYLSTELYQLGIPSWDYTSPAPNYAFAFPTVQLAGLFATLTALLGGGAFLVIALKQMFIRDRQSIQPFVWTLLSLLVIALLISLFLAETLFHRSFGLITLTWPILATGIATFLLFTLMSNLLRLRQGIRNAELSLRFMFPTLLPGLVIIAIIGTMYFSLFWFPMEMLSRSAYLIRFVPTIVTIIGAVFGGVIYLVRGMRRATFSPRFLRLTFRFASLTALAMMVTLGLLLFQLQAIDLHINAQGLALLSVPLLHIIVFCIALPTLFSCISLWHGFKAQRALALA